MSLQKSLSSILYVFFAIGIGLAGVAGYLAIHQRQALAQASRADGTVVDLEEGPSMSGGSVRSRAMYYPVVEYTTATGERVRFRGATASRPPAFDRGEAVTVLYEPSQPEKAKINALSELWFIPLVSGGIGTLFILMGGCPLLYMALSRRRSAWLKEHGQRVQADIAEVILDTRYRLNGQHPYRIIAQWQDPAQQTLRTFRSDAIWFDPAPFVKTKKVDVLIDPNDPKRYWMNTSFLPKEA